MAQDVVVPLSRLYEAHGEESVLAGMASLGILESELQDPNADEIRAALPEGTPDRTIERKVAIAGRKRDNLLRELKQKMAYVKPHEAKLYLTIPCGAEPAWDDLQKTLGGLDVSVGESSFFRTQSERNARSRERFLSDSRRKFCGFVEDMMLEKKRKDDGEAKQQASVKRLKDFKKDQDKFYATRAAAVKKKMDSIAAKNAKDKADMLVRAEESDIKIAEKYARGDAAKQAVLDKMQARADELTEHFEDVQENVRDQRRDFEKKAKHKSKVEFQRQKAYLDGQEEMRKQQVLDSVKRAEEFREFIRRKDAYQAMQQKQREDKYLDETDKLNKIREAGSQARLNRSKSMGSMMAKREATWQRRNQEVTQERNQFNARIMGMLDTQTQQVSDARERLFVTDVIERRTRHGLFGDLQQANAERNHRSVESMKNSTLVKVTLRNKAAQHLSSQRDLLTRERQNMTRELGVEATRTREIFSQIKAETDPVKVKSALSKLGFADLVDGAPPAES